MRNFGAHIDCGIFHFNVVAEVHRFADHAVRANMDERADIGFAFHNRLIALGVVENHVVTDGAVFDNGIGAYLAVFADDDLAAQNRAGVNDGVHADDHVGVNDHAVKARNIHARLQMRFEFAHSGNVVELVELAAVICTKHHVGRHCA